MLVAGASEVTHTQTPFRELWFREGVRFISSWFHNDVSGRLEGRGGYNSNFSSSLKRTASCLPQISSPREIPPGPSAVPSLT